MSTRWLSSRRVQSNRLRFKVFDIAEPRVCVCIPRQSRTSTPCRHTLLYIIISSSFLLVLFPMIDARCVHTCGEQRWYASTPVARTLQSEINSNYVFPEPPYSLSAFVRRLAVAEMLMGRLRRADGRRRYARARVRARAHTPEEDKWLKEIVYQNGFDFYVLL